MTGGLKKTGGCGLSTILINLKLFQNQRFTGLMTDLVENAGCRMNGKSYTLIKISGNPW